MLERFRLDGQVALVTGGSRGIGLAIANVLGEAGARLVVSSKTRNEAAIYELEAAGYELHHIEADLSEPGAARAVVEKAQALVGRLDILVNNAGVARHGATEVFPEQSYRDVMSINLDAVFGACQAVIPIMKAQKSGVILNIGSISGLVSNIPQQQVAYNASKAAVHMLTRSLASDLAAFNIRVNAIAPGYITTDMTVGGLADPDWAPTWLNMTPMGRPGSAEEVAAAALFLCSLASSYVTGEILVVDGGYTSR